MYKLKYPRKTSNGNGNPRLYQANRFSYLAGKSRGVTGHCFVHIGYVRDILPPFRYGNGNPRLYPANRFSYFAGKSRGVTGHCFVHIGYVRDILPPFLF